MLRHRAFMWFIKLVCFALIVYGVVDGYIVFEKRHDNEYVESFAYQLFVVGESIARVLFPYCLARGVLILFEERW